MKERRKMILGSLLGLLLVATLSTAPAQARNSVGDITLKVTGTCSAPGDSIKRVSVWTPEKGHKQVKPARHQTKSSVVDFGKFRKTTKGNTYFNWDVDCWMGGKSGGQKWYGGNAFQTSYHYSVKNFYGKVSGI